MLATVAAAVVTRGDAIGAAIAATAPYDVVASGFEDPAGVAVQSEGSVLVVDRRAGSLIRVSPGGVRETVLSGLRDPRDVAAAAGNVFVLEPDRVLRLDPAGIVSVVSGPVPDARAMAAGPDGHVWIAVRPSSSREDVILRLEPSGSVTRVASGLVDIRGLAADQAGLYVALWSLAGESSDRTTLARLAIRPDGALGPAQSLLRNSPRQPTGVAIDAAGQVFITGFAADRYGTSGVVLKRRAEGGLALVASGLVRPAAAAFGPGRHLFVVERGVRARVLAFRPPPVVTVSAPPFTNLMPVRIPGVAQADSLVVVAAPDGSGALTSVRADSVTGRFVISAPIAENAATRLSITATGAAGGGLVSLPATVTVVHDDHVPFVEVLEPVATVHVATALTVRARARDEGSGIETLRVTVDEVAHSTLSPLDGEPVVSNEVIDMTAYSEGMHALTALAFDRAGNWATVSRVAVVDRTPPDTAILAGPADEITGGIATFAVAGSDGQSDDLEFAWRLDAGAWSPFSAGRTATLAGLAGGPHLFEVVARDRAGNVDATPAVQRFTVIPVRVRIAEPLPGAVITTQTVWMRGSVEGGAEVDVSVPLDAPLRQQLGVEALPAPNEGNTFAVEVPVVRGMKGLTVVARDATGGQSSETVVLTVLEPLERPLRLAPFPAAGLAPLTVRFSLVGIPAGSAYSLDLESDGIQDDEGNGLAQREYVYARPGVHVVTLTATEPGGQVLVARGLVEVYDRARLEARLGAVWGGFRAAMRAGDLAAAAAFLHRDRRAAWAGYFGRMTPAQLAATDALFTDLRLVEASPGRAECEMMRDEGGLLFSFPVSFALDVDGGWKLWQF